MSIYDIKAPFRKRTLILPSDTDRIVFVNNRSNHWEDGSPVTVEEIVSFLRFYGQDRQKEPEERIFRCPIHFADAVKDFEYGNAILFDETGEPVIKVENGIILSATERCGCEVSFPPHEPMTLRTANDYEHFRQRVEESGQFELLKRKAFAKEQRYRCRACGNVWLLGKPDMDGCYLWKQDKK